MTLIAEVVAASEALRKEIAASLRAVSKLGGHVDLATPGSRSNDGMGIADEFPANSEITVKKESEHVIKPKNRLKVNHLPCAPQIGTGNDRATNR